MSAIKAGISVSLTGQFRTQGRQALAGLRAWVEDVNLAGGLEVDGRWVPLSPVHYDDGSLTEGAAQATRRLIEADRVDLLFGPYSSGLARAAAAVAAEHGQVLWNQGGAAESVYRPGRLVVGILTGAEEYLAALPGLVRSADPSAKSYAILRCAVGAFPKQVGDGFERQALGQGFTRVYHREFSPEQSEFSDLVKEAVEANPDLLVVVGRIRHDLAIAKALTHLWRKGRRLKATAVVAAGIDRFRLELGNYVDGFIGPSQWEPPSRAGRGRLPNSYFGPSPVKVMESLRRAGDAAGGLPVDYPMAQAYAAGLVAQQCVQQAGTLEPSLLWAAAGQADFHTFFGRFRIDPENGRQVGRSVAIIQWQQGRKVVIWPPEQQQGSLAIR